MTPTSFLRLNMYLWLAKTCRLEPSNEGSARAFRYHYQSKIMTVRTSEVQSAEAEPEFGIYTFVFCLTTPSPIVVYKNKWLGDWASFWFITKSPLTWR